MSKMHLYRCLIPKHILLLPSTSLAQHVNLDPTSDVVSAAETHSDILSPACSWLYLSRLAAMKEYAFMVALGEHGLPVPYAVAHNRHCVLMTMVDAVPLVQVTIPLSACQFCLHANCLHVALGSYHDCYVVGLQLP